MTAPSAASLAAPDRLARFARSGRAPMPFVWQLRAMVLTDFCPEKQTTSRPNDSGDVEKLLKNQSYIPDQANLNGVA